MEARRLAALPLVVLGGLVGASSRYALGANSGGALVTTLAVNTVGCFCLALLLYGLRDSSGIDRGIRFLLGTGFLASFTSYSTLVADAWVSGPVLGGGYLFATYTCGIVAFVAGRGLATRFRSGGT